MLTNSMRSRDLWVICAVFFWVSCGNESTQFAGGKASPQKETQVEPKSDDLIVEDSPSSEITEPSLPSTEDAEQDFPTQDHENNVRPKIALKDSYPPLVMAPTLTQVQRFPTALVESTTVSLNLGDNSYTQSFRMSSRLQDKEVQFRQRERPMRTDNFFQGADGELVYEEVSGIQGRALDVLIVIDNSKSMLEEQYQLSSKLLPLLSFVQGTDWRIGVVTTDPAQTCLAQLIHAEDANATELFAAAIKQGIRGAPNERGFLTAVNSLKGECLGKQWIRDHSALALLFVSDEDNCSDGKECGEAPWGKVSYIYDYLEEIRKPGETVQAHGLIWHPSDNIFSCITGTNHGHQYAELIERTGGTWGSICARDYTPTLEAISKNMELGIRNFYTLAQQPLEESLTVYMDGAVVKEGYTTDGRVVRFTQGIAENKKLAFTYRLEKGNLSKQFPLSAAPFQEQLQVKINSKSVSQDQYVYDSRSQSLSFAQEPPKLARIEVSYKEETQLPRKFFVGRDLVPSTLSVEWQGEDVTAASYLDTAGYLVLDFIPAAGDLLKLRFQTKAEPILAYPFYMPKGANLSLVRLFDDEPLDFEYKSNKIFIDESGFLDGEYFLAEVSGGREPFSMQVILPQAPIPSTLRLSLGPWECDQALYLVDRSLDVKECYTPGLEQVTVHYDYIVESRQRFKLNGELLPAPTESQEWIVKFDGKKLDETQYRREGYTVVFDETLNPGSVVEIQVTYAQAPSAITQ